MHLSGREIYIVIIINNKRNRLRTNGVGLAIKWNAFGGAELVKDSLSFQVWYVIGDSSGNFGPVVGIATFFRPLIH